MSIQDYANKYYLDAQAVSYSGLPPAFILAHSYLESGKGISQLSTKANNFFGVKAKANQPFITMQTRELRNGKYIVIPQNFAKYASAKDSFKAYGSLLKIVRYKPVLNAISYLDKARELRKTGYYGAEPAAQNNLAILATKFEAAIKNRPNTTLIIPLLLIAGIAGYLVYKI